jgi:hypothetical protein
MIRSVLVVLALGLSGLLSFAFAADRPNIVLIYADDLGYGDVSFNGAKAGLTPNVDRLALRANMKAPRTRNAKHVCARH